MFGILRSKKGFTLVELIVVVIIVGILAAVAIPMMSGNLAKAKKSEAMAACGSLRTAARLYYVEKTAWPTSRADLIGYVTNADLNGTYYGPGNYSVSSGIITANGAPGWVNLNVNIGVMTDG